MMEDSFRKNKYDNMDKTSMVSVPISIMAEPAASLQLHNCMDIEGFKADNDVELQIPTDNQVETNATHGSCGDACVKDSISGSLKKNVVKNASCSIPTGEIWLSLKDPGLFTDRPLSEACTEKTLMEIEPSKALENLKNSVIKDICIDEGTPPLDKILIKDDEVEYEKVLFLQSDLDAHDHLSKEVHSGLLASDDFKSFILKEKVFSSEDDLLLSKGNVNISLGKEDMMEESVNVVSNGESMSEETSPVNEPEVQNLKNLPGESSCCEKSSDQPCHQGQQGNTDAVVRPYIANDEQTCTSPVASERIGSVDDTMHSPTNNEVESRAIILNSDLLPSEQSIRKEETAANAGHQQSGQSSIASVLDDGVRDSLTGSKRSFFGQNGLGESSFSGVDSKFDPIALSGGGQFSGSISFRSDSSTTSQRSFAFPILHSEWNTSPVKMARAERSHFRKHRGWKVAFLCCRF